MTTFGIVIVIIDILGMLWARFTNPSIGDFFNYAFTGGSAFKIHAYRFFNGYGFVVLVIGIILIIWGEHRKNKNKTVSVGSLKHSTDAQSKFDTSASIEGKEIGADVKLVLDPETREIKWICGNCGHCNSCDDLNCANCNQRR